MNYFRQRSRLRTFRVILQQEVEVAQLAEDLRLYFAFGLQDEWIVAANGLRREEDAEKLALCKETMAKDWETGEKWCDGDVLKVTEELMSAASLLAHTLHGRYISAPDWRWLTVEVSLQIKTFALGVFFGLQLQIFLINEGSASLKASFLLQNLWSRRVQPKGCFHYLRSFLSALYKYASRWLTCSLTYISWPPLQRIVSAYDTQFVQPCSKRA